MNARAQRAFLNDSQCLRLAREPVALLLIYRSAVLGGDTGPFAALAAALRARGIPVAGAVVLLTVLATLLGHARLHRYPGGHLALLTDADRLAPVIESFLDDSPDPDDERRTP